MTISRPPIVTTGSWPDSMVRKNVKSPAARRSSGTVYVRHFSKIARFPAGGASVSARPSTGSPSAAVGRAIRGCVIRLPCPRDFTTAVHDPATREIPVPGEPRAGPKVRLKWLCQSYLRVRYVTKPGRLQHLVRLLRVEGRRLRRKRGKCPRDVPRGPNESGGNGQAKGPAGGKIREPVRDGRVIEDLRVRYEERLAPRIPREGAPHRRGDVRTVDHVDARP